MCAVLLYAFLLYFFPPDLHFLFIFCLCFVVIISNFFCFCFSRGLLGGGVYDSQRRRTWEHFWLNEGWTMWLERNIMSKVRKNTKRTKFNTQQKKNASNKNKRLKTSIVPLTVAGFPSGASMQGRCYSCFFSSLLAPNNSLNIVGPAVNNISICCPTWSRLRGYIVKHLGGVYENVDCLQD